MKKKSKKAEINTEEVKKEPVKPRFYNCTTCDQQCAGHGGGAPALHGGCLCFDGVHLECLI